MKLLVLFLFREDLGRAKLSDLDIYVYRPTKEILDNVQNEVDVQSVQDKSLVIFHWITWTIESKLPYPTISQPR